MFCIGARFTIPYAREEVDEETEERCEVVNDGGKAEGRVQNLLLYTKEICMNTF